MPTHSHPLIHAAADDLSVELRSSALQHVTVDVVVSGSIAAVESLHLVRALRRLGARVQVVLSRGGELFIGKAALEWASAARVQSDFCGHTSHLAHGDLCVIAPASANFLARIRAGMADDVAAARVQSYLGSRPERVIVVPCMHDSLLSSPFVTQNIGEHYGQNQVLWGAAEEGKRKFPQPDVLASHISHYYHRLQLTPDPALVVMGATRGYLDDVRFMQSFSSGDLGCEVAEELHLWGIEVRVIMGDVRRKPSSIPHITKTLSHEEMLHSAQSHLKERPSHIIMLASVLDYLPKTPHHGKIPSGRRDLSVTLTPTSKIRSQLFPGAAPCGRAYHKICFKLEPELLSLEQHRALLLKWHAEDGVDVVVMNALEDMKEGGYRARCLHHKADRPEPEAAEYHSKRALARHLRSSLQRQYLREE